MTFCRDRQRDAAGGREAGVRRRRPRHAQHRRLTRSRPRSRRAPAPSCRCTSPACRWTWTPVTRWPKRRGLRVIEDAAHAIGARSAGQRIGAQRRPGLVQLPPEQEPHHRRGRRARAAPTTAEVEHAERAALPRHRRLPGGEMEVEEPGRQVQHARRCRAHRPRAARAPGGIQRAPPRARAALFRAAATVSRSAPAGTPTSPGTRGTCSRRSSTSPRSAPRGARSSSDGRAWHRRRRALPGDASLRRLPPARLQAGDFPNAETIGARTLTLPLFTRMQDSDVDRVCAALREAILQPITSNGHS